MRTSHAWFMVAWLIIVCTASSQAPYQATGLKIGEVTDTSAIVWTRLTRDPERVVVGAPIPVVQYRNPADGSLKDETSGGRTDWAPVVEFPNGSTIDTIEGAVPGCDGATRVSYRVKGQSEWSSTEWRPVDSERDFTRQFDLRGLTPGTEYEVRVESRAPSGEPGQSFDGEFHTAPDADTPSRVLFTVTTGQMYDDRDDPIYGFLMYDAMSKLNPDFFAHTGDILYYDKLGKSVPLARWHWQRTYSLPTNIRFHRRTASYFIKDDHDTWCNDCWPTMESKFMGDLTFAQGQSIFLEQVPMRERTYRTFRWGKDLQVWLVEGRDFRSPNPMPDGPEKTIWGEEQKAWFKKTVSESDATFRVLISPTPLVGPDRPNKNDNHANAGFQHEGDELRQFIASQKNMIVVCGDRHWQYVSVDKSTGVREYSCGPASDAHAGGWQPDDRKPEHVYLNVTGGFLAVVVERVDDKPTLTMRHYSVHGQMLNEDTLSGS